MAVTISTYSMEAFHGEAEEYVKKLIAQKTGLPYCARCQGTHASVTWKRVTNPVMSGPEGARSSAIIAWAMCPTLDEPVFVEAWEDDSNNDSNSNSKEDTDEVRA